MKGGDASVGRDIKIRRTVERCLACEAVVARETLPCHALHCAGFYRLAIENEAEGVIVKIG